MIRRLVGRLDDILDYAAAPVITITADTHAHDARRAAWRTYAAAALASGPAYAEEYADRMLVLETKRFGVEP